MQAIKRYASGLFAHNFLLLLTLMLCCLGLWFAVFLQSGVSVRAYEMSQRIASAVNLTGTALRHAQDKNPSELLAELSRHESLDVHVRLNGDVLTPLPDERYWRLMEQHLHTLLGAETIIAWEVNHLGAFWVSFTNDRQQYWLAFERQKIRETTPIQWASWILAAALLSLIGALMSTRYLNRPLTRLARFAQSLAAGQHPTPLPESGAREIQLVNKSFNFMAQALRQTESDREMMLAGLSHDLRTPLTRMRLEIEMSTIPEVTRTLIDHDLEQVDHSISALIEFARASSAANQTTDRSHIPSINVSQALMRLVSCEAELGRTQRVTIRARIDGTLNAHIDPFDLQRIVINLIENTKRYGRNCAGIAEICVRAEHLGHELLLEISDTGPGITQHEAQEFMRPFSRGNQARTDCTGTGLGLAIAERLVTQARGTMHLIARPNQGLLVRIRIPAS